MIPGIRSSEIRNMIIAILVIFITGPDIDAQDYRYGIYASPAISWFKTDVEEVRNKGARAGFMFNISAERHLTDNWYFSSGLAYTGASARIVDSNSSFFRFPDFTATIAAGEAVIYRLQYISIPVGIKIKTDETGYLVYFAEFGLDPKAVINGRVDIPSIGIKGRYAMTEIRRLNFGFHLQGGAEYSIDGNTSLILGLGFESNIIDITKDYDSYISDRTFHRLLKVIFGINF